MFVQPAEPDEHRDGRNGRSGYDVMATVNGSQAVVLRPTVYAAAVKLP